MADMMSNGTVLVITAIISSGFIISWFAFSDRVGGNTSNVEDVGSLVVAKGQSL